VRLLALWLLLKYKKSSCVLPLKSLLQNLTCLPHCRDMAVSDVRRSWCCEHFLRVKCESDGLGPIR